MTGFTDTTTSLSTDVKGFKKKVKKFNQLNKTDPDG